MTLGWETEGDWMHVELFILEQCECLCFSNHLYSKDTVPVLIVVGTI